MHYVLGKLICTFSNPACCFPLIQPQEVIDFNLIPTYFVVVFPFLVLIQKGCEHEKKTTNDFITEEQGLHHSVIYLPAGCVICKRVHLIGASPDGWVCCSHCGPGILEVKCPHSCRQKFRRKRKINCS